MNHPTPRQAAGYIFGLLFLICLGAGVKHLFFDHPKLKESLWSTPSSQQGSGTTDTPHIDEMNNDANYGYYADPDSDVLKTTGPYPSKDAYDSAVARWWRRTHAKAKSRENL